MVRTGTSGYNYPEWRGRFYPETLAAAKMLPYYAERFPTVEINYTFYRMPTVKTVAGWAAEVPEHFAFSLKAPRRITHERRLKDCADPLAFFCQVAAALGPRLGVLLFQLPPNLRRDLERLDAFLALLPPGVRAAFEFRHDSWLDEAVYDRLRTRNLALCLADDGERATPTIATADYGYLRLRDDGYAPDDLDAWAARIGSLPWRDAFVYFKHEDEARSPELAAAFARRFTPPATR